MSLKYEEQAKLFLKKRTVQKDNLVITKAEAIAALSDFAEQMMKSYIEGESKNRLKLKWYQELVGAFKNRRY